MCNTNRNALQCKILSSGFTLVELLIVITIIGILVALLMPAVQSAQESGRRANCASNLRQLALGWLTHESKQQYFPGGGWGWQWAGESDRGFGTPQPGGWHFSILPYIDQSDLFNLDKGMQQSGDTATSNSARMAAGQKQAETPVAVFICPTRHRFKTFPMVWAQIHGGPSYCNIPDPSPNIGRSDYAANGGSDYLGVPGRDDPSYNPTFDWSTVGETINSTSSPSTGVIGVASEVTTAMIKDGTSYTYMIGERYMDPYCYEIGNCCDNDQGWDQGYDWDSVRGTGINYVYINPTTGIAIGGARPLPGVGTPIAPMQDRSGYETNGGCSYNFGSAHNAGFYMAFCDGSVVLINYSIDPVLHMTLGHRADGEPTQLQGISAGK